MIVWERNRGFNYDNYESYIERHGYKTTKMDRPGYESYKPTPPMSESQFYYLISGQFHTDLAMLETTCGVHSFNHEDFDRLRDKWWKEVYHEYVSD